MPRSRAPVGRTFSDALRARTDDELVLLLRERPDLGVPAPSTLLSLAARAASRTSLDRALTRLDALELQVLEAVLALDLRESPAPGTPSRVPPGAPDSTARAAPVTADAVVLAVAGPDGPLTAVRSALARLGTRALVWDAAPAAASAPARTGHPEGVADGAPSADLRAAPGVEEALGPYPAGLGPSLPVPADSAPVDLSPAALEALLATAPAHAREILDALTWGPPVGLAPRAGHPAGSATTWLVGHGLLVRTDDRHVVLPRAVGLALRGGRTHRGADAAPPRPEAPSRADATVAAESAEAARETVRQVTHLVRLWADDPPGVLRSGGLGVRDLRRLARDLDVDESSAALVAELALTAGLVADDGQDSPAFSPTAAAEDWPDLELSARWAVLARAWATSSRTPWLVGTRDERGARRSPLDPDLQRPWVTRLRRGVLGALAAQPGAALDEDDVQAVLAWHTPRARPPAQAVQGLLREAALLGVTGAGALSGPGAALLGLLESPADPDGPTGTARSTGRAGAGASPDLAAALDAVLPAEVDDLLLQGDLTGIVPGRPSRALERLVDAAAEVESRGAATTVRFTPQSVVRALDLGMTADEILDELAAHTRSGVPQPLAYLVTDTARRHGRLRVGAAMSYVRTDDPTLLAGLAENPALRHLQLVRVAPTVLVAHAPAAELQEVLRSHGLVSAVEGTDGRVLLGARPGTGRPGGAARPTGRSPWARPEPSGRAGPVTEHDRVADAARLVARLRATDVADTARSAGEGASPRDDAASGEAPDVGRATTGAARGDGARRSRAIGRDDPGNGAGTQDPADALALLREAITAGSMVWLEVVGPQGVPTRRRVRPLTLDGGRLRAQDLERDAELTVAVHRIASATADDAPA